jgi:peptidoglycan/LPS O-acetylase OafA/YrhL
LAESELKMEIAASISRPRTKLHAGDRLHGIDALRGIAMMLGILLHATIAYKVKPLPNWPHDMTFNHWSFDLIYHYIHSFRMPLFFLIAGYFSRLLLIKLGERSFVLHRFKKIFVPFVFSLVFILPFTIFPFLVYQHLNDYSGQWRSVFQKAFSQVFQWNGLAHLWFLYYLIIFYVVVIGYFRLVKLTIVGKIHNAVSRLTTAVRPGSLKGMVVFSVLIGLALLMSEGLYIHVDTGAIPGIEYLLFYIVFFYIGWLVNKSDGDFQWMADNYRLNMIAGSVLCILLFLVDYSGVLFNGVQTLLLKMIVAFQIVILVYGVIGLFLRCLTAESSLWRYVSDASYFIYLVHLGLIAALQIWLTQTDVPGIWRIVIVLILPIIISMFIYQKLVRYTIIGEYLHGKRKRKVSMHA